MATNAGLIGVLKHLAEACEARNFNIHLELDGLSAEEQEATRLLVRAINDYQAAVESEQNSKLKEAFGRAKVVTEASPNGLTLWDRDCNLFDCNEAYVRLFKLKNLQEFLERHRELSPEYQPDGWLSGDKICAMVKKAFAEGTCEFEWTHQTSDGALIPCHVKMVRVAYEDDYVVVGYLRDLREQKAMMSEIARKGALVSMANQVAGILLESDVVDFNDTVQRCLKMMGETVNADRASIWVNSVKDGRLYCTQIHEWLGNAESQINKDITREVSYDDVISGWEATLSSGRCINALVRDMPAVIQEQVKQQNILSLCVVPIFVQGHFWGYMGFDHCHRERVLYEVEEDVLRSCGMMLANALLRHEMMQNIRAATAAKSNFLANMSHEIRTPMNVILGITEIQLQDETLAPHYRRALDTIHSAGDLLLNLINDILDLSKIEAGKLELLIAKYETASLINDTMTLNMMRVGSRRIDFELSVDENLPESLFGDELRIKQILNNLLSNAFKYTEEGVVKLRVSSRACSDSDDVALVIAVTDTGEGMTEEQLGMMFDQYSRFNVEAHRTVQGTGLGMNIVKNLLNLMNGTITVTSQLDSGSEVVVTIPQKRADAGVLSKELVANLQSFNINGAKQIRRAQIAIEPMPYGSVLIVDDVESNLYVGKGLLSPYGLSIDTVMSGFEAIDRVKSGKVYDIVFMDHMMPKMDGIEAVKIIRELGYAHPIVALTANAVVGQSDIFLANGFDDFISKPVDLRRLDTVLNKFVRDRHPPEVVEAASQQKNSMREHVADSAPQTSVEPNLVKIFIRDAFKSLAVLEAFCEKQNDYNNEDLREYVVNIHGIKSALANIGALELSARASKLEQAGRGQDSVVILSETPAFLDALRALIEQITPKEDGERSKATDEDQAYLHEKLLALKAACLAYNKKAAKNALAEIEQKAWPSPTGKMLDTIAEQLLHSKFKAIVSVVDEIIGE